MPDYKETKVDIGPESSFSKFPAPVDIGQWSYFLSKGEEGLPAFVQRVPPPDGRSAGLGRRVHVPGPWLAFRVHRRRLRQRAQLEDGLFPGNGGKRTSHRRRSGRLGRLNPDYLLRRRRTGGRGRSRSHCNKHGAANTAAGTVSPFRLRLPGPPELLRRRHGKEGYPVSDRDGAFRASYSPDRCPRWRPPRRTSTALPRWTGS